MKITRRALLLTPLASRRAKADIGRDELVERTRAFHVPWDQFVRSLFGCGKSATSTGDCDSNRGVIDYGAFMKAGRAARKLFTDLL
jgi:hypothetical protein